MSVPAEFRVACIENRKPGKFEHFLTGFLIGGNKAHFGTLVGVAIHPDGSLLVSDDTNGVVCIGLRDGVERGKK